MIELNNIHLATEEDHHYQIDKWASLFKANTWEDIRMLIHDNPTLQTAAETLYRLNMDERFRETCERFEQAEIEHNSILHRNMKLAQTNEELTLTNQKLTLSNQELTLSNQELTAKLAELEALLASHSNADIK